MEELKDNTYDTKEKGVTATLNFLNKTDYNELISYQEDTVCSHILEEGKKKRK